MNPSTEARVKLLYRQGVHVKAAGIDKARTHKFNYNPDVRELAGEERKKFLILINLKGESALSPKGYSHSLTAEITVYVLAKTKPYLCSVVFTAANQASPWVRLAYCDELEEFEKVSPLLNEFMSLLPDVLEQVREDLAEVSA